MNQFYKVLIIFPTSRATKAFKKRQFGSSGDISSCFRTTLKTMSSTSSPLTAWTRPLFCWLSWSMTRTLFQREGNRTTLYGTSFATSYQKTRTRFAPSTLMLSFEVDWGDIPIRFDDAALRNLLKLHNSCRVGTFSFIVHFVISLKKYPMPTSTPGKTVMISWSNSIHNNHWSFALPNIYHLFRSL